MRKIYRMTAVITLIILIIAIPIIGKIFINRGIKLNVGVNGEDELQGDITFVSNRTDKREEIQNLINNFETLYPNVKVNLELIGDAETILQRKASVGELPDVTLVPSTIYKDEYSNYFLPIDDLGFNDNNIYNYDMGTGNDSKLYCLNSSVNWQGVIYNKDIFEDANIEKLPNTIEELFETCEQLKNYGVTPIAINYRQTWTMNLWADVIPHLFDNNLCKNTAGGNKIILDSDSGMYKSLTLVREIVNRGYCEEDLLNYDWQQFKNDMSIGKIAMTIWSSDFMYQLEDMGMDPDCIGMFPIPESIIVKIYGDYKFAVSKKTENPEVAKEFLKYIFEDDRYAEAVNIMSPLKKEGDKFSQFKELEKYNIPIEIYSDYVRNQSSEDAKFEEVYLQIKKRIGIDYTFVQKYIIEDNIESLITDTNRKWQTAIE